MSTSTIVTSLGNSWIICRSKTYAGRIYYFNTLTGEAAWNLSESEIEKAKKRTSILQTQTGFQIDNCPEPKDSPQDESSQIISHSNVQKIPSQNIVPSKVYNKQIINNQFPKPSFPSTGTYYPLSALNPVQYNMAVTPNVDPNMVWNFHPQPIFVAPNVINQQPVMNTTLNNYDYVPVTNTSVPLSSRFKNLSQSQRKNRVSIGNTFRDRKNNFRNRFHNSRNKMDLRLLLSSKKRKQNIGKNDLNEVEDFQAGQFDAKLDSIIQNTDKRITFHHLISCDDNDDDDDDIWLEENQSKIQSSKDSLDISPLRKLLQVEKSFDVWYIVLDSNVLLNNINFLKILLSLDNQCRLMVPQAVMNKIQKATNTSLRTLAHRAAYFISQQVDASIAVIDQINEEESTDDKAVILNCCSKLTDQGYPVVLLTDDVELHNLEDNTPFQVLTVKQVKNILSKTVSNVSISKSLEDLTLSQSKSRNIVITIPNDVNKTNLNYVKQNKCESAMICPTEVHSEANSVPKDGASENVARNVVETNKMHKTSDDVGFQTNEINLLHDTNDKITLKDNENKLCKNSRSILNRSLSTDVNIELDSTEKQKPRWHKRRTKSISNQSKVNYTEQIKSVNISKEYNLSSNENLVPLVSSDSLNQNCNINSEKSCFEQRSINDNSMVEKAFSLGTSCKRRNFEMDNNKIVADVTKDIVEEKCLLKNSDIEDKNVMFEVTSSDMEECLRRKCDEWISRFVQIIEEGCTQVLQQDPPFILDTMLPPWTLYEATECIKRKFFNDNDIVDASNKLLHVLFEIGGLRGKIKSNISPQKYMEMYSYGVYLIDALQGLLTNSEDLQIAAESLSKLLSDIQNTNLYSDSRFEDSFTDVLPETLNDVAHEKSSNEEKIMEPVNPIEEKAANESEYKILTFTNNSPNKKTKTESIGAPGSYNLRSQKKKLLQDQDEFSDKTTLVRNIDPESSFFMSLRLKRNADTNKDLDVYNDVNKSIDNDVNIEDRDKVESVGTENFCESVSKENENVDIGNPEHENNISNEPKVIRNFTLCPEFENRLKEKEKVYDSWTSKNEAYQNDMISEDSEPFDYDSMENQYYGCDYEMYDTEDMSEVNSFDRCIENEESVISATEKTNIHFKDIAEKIEHNIRETFSSVHRFCEKCYTTLSSNNRNFKKREMQHVAEETYLYLSNLCDALNSILSRESMDSAYKIQELLKLEELREIILEDDDLEGYRYIKICNYLMFTSTIES
ncbi:unnamed protein product [Euphydryas editha]|uniref:PIN domain-containing protein n=1 Tax=Euphydryas editha TaxID=104508 RepID=A0AAU9TEK2_EUPED|nr:unnamed protein product [Euphydryas editha]